ncbi:MAG: hypothetical protein ACLT3F_04645 [Gemmiger formicilis]|uniref:hypothetical protein n=1 Tax=Gemmiger formicilis TaxID=745368 RepID=UPI0039910C71
MYTIKRRTRLKDTLRLEDGDRVLNVPVEIDIDTAIASYWKHYEQLKLAQDQLKKKDSDESRINFGNAFMTLLIFLFGQEWAQKMVEFYDGRYTEMLTDLYPYIDGEIYPRLKKASQEKARTASRLGRR